MEPILATVLDAPTPAFLMTVGKSSAANTQQAGKAIDWAHNPAAANKDVQVEVPETVQTTDGADNVY